MTHSARSRFDSSISQAVVSYLVDCVMTLTAKQLDEKYREVSFFMDEYLECHPLECMKTYGRSIASELATQLQCIKTYALRVSADPACMQYVKRHGRPNFPEVVSSCYWAGNWEWV